MKKFIQDLFGITQLIEEKKKQTEILEKIHYECKRNSDYVKAYNKFYHVPH